VADKIIAFEHNKFIKVIAVIDRVDKDFLDILVWAKVIRNPKITREEILKRYLGTVHMQHAVGKSVKADESLFEFTRWVTWPASPRGEEPKVIPTEEGKKGVAWGLAFKPKPSWDDVKDELDWAEYVEEQAKWFIEDIMNMPEFQDVKGVYKLKPGSLSKANIYNLIGK